MQKAFSKALKHFAIDWKDKDILLALSGGLDSVTLFHLLLNEGISFRAAHVNYGLRGEDSEADEQFVRDLCIEHKVELDVMRVEKDHWKGQNVQNEARKIRYGFFASLQPDFIFLAFQVCPQGQNDSKVVVLGREESR